MNYRRKKVSMKEQLEQAIDEIGGEQLQRPGVDRETPEEKLSEIEPAGQGFARSNPEPCAGMWPV
jgi:hypothetical protein